jgi:hypothetical protein
MVNFDAEDAFIVKVAKTVKDAQELVESGFELP